MRINKSGFTIVELLVVIVVIAILASISVVAYNGIQNRAVSSARVNDMATLMKALEMYKAKNGYYPATQSNSTGGWERSAVNPDNFLRALKDEGFLSQVPVDPINEAPQGSTGPENTFTSYTYYLYPAGSTTFSTCPASYGAIYVLKIEHPGQPRIDGGSGVRCGSTQLLSGGGTGTPYVTGRTTN